MTSDRPIKQTRAWQKFQGFFHLFFSWQHKVIKLTFRLSLAAHLDKIRTQQRSVPCHRGRNIDCLSWHLALKDMDSLKYVAENSPLVCGILPRVQEAVYFLITTFVLIMHASHMFFLNDFLDYYYCYIK